jgi:PhoD related phosphatase
MSCPVPGHTATAWRFDFAIAQTAQWQVLAYTVGGQNFAFNVPAISAMPSLAYASCNGFSSASAMWSVLPDMQAWAQLDRPARVAAPFTAAMQTALTAYCSKIYLERWSRPDGAAALGAIPTVMMWDDHDIMDGWGSHPADLHECAVFQGIYNVARAAFGFFQREIMQPDAHAPATLPRQSAHSSGYRMGAAGLLTLDMRSERCPRSGDVNAVGGVLHAEQVMS